MPLSISTDHVQTFQRQVATICRGDVIVGYLQFSPANKVYEAVSARLMSILRADRSQGFRGTTACSAKWLPLPRTITKAHTGIKC